MPLRFLILLTIFLNTGDPLYTQNKYAAESKPWTYWWWMGSSVTKSGITENLEVMSAAGIGGVHIIPIYGEKGDEKNYLRFLSRDWMQMLNHTVTEAKRLGMGVDMTSGTGWPFGGPFVLPDNAAKKILIREFVDIRNINVSDCLRDGEQGTFIALAAYDKEGIYSDLTNAVNSDGNIDQVKISNIKPAKMFVLFESPTCQQVKRAAPGGEGLVLDYFSKNSVTGYMTLFEDAFKSYGIPGMGIRSFYNDSYEVYGANWTDNFFSEFEKRRGYKLLPSIKFIADTSLERETRKRILTDYCETISDLMIDDFATTWIKKSHEMGIITRYQAHGSPANLLDLYSLADIPETESFGASGFRIPGLRQDSDYEEDRFGRPDKLTMKFASSAGNLTGRRLVSSESTTWLGDHFKVSLSQIKPQIDELFVCGINHIFYHGTTYTPPEKPFPGRLFYASTNYNQHSHFFNELPALNNYIARVQEVLQSSDPDNEILLYFPVHEIWKNLDSDILITLFDVHRSRKWLHETSFGRVALELQEYGYGFDFISDRLLQSLEMDGKLMASGKARYKAIIVPAVSALPPETLKRLRDLALGGAVVIFENDIPADVPGFYDIEKRKELTARIREELLSMSPDVIVSSSVLNSLKNRMIFGEEFAQKGLDFIRKRSGDSTVYFVANLTDRFREGWIQMTFENKEAEIYDPLSGKRGKAIIRRNSKGTLLYLQISPGQTCIITCLKNPVTKDSWEYIYPDEKKKMDIGGEWLLTPVTKGQALPEPVIVSVPGSWTEAGGNYEYYSGKAVYTRSFSVPSSLITSPGFILDMGNVRESARVKINGKDLGLSWSVPFQLLVREGIIRKDNIIEIEVTNLSFNRVIKLDLEEVKWKNYNEINFVDIRYQPYDASDKKPEDSGLLSKVFLIPLTRP